MSLDKGYTELPKAEFIAGSDQHFIYNTKLLSADILAVEWVLKSNDPYQSSTVVQKTLSSGVTVLENGIVQVDLSGTDTAELKGKYSQFITIDTTERYRPATGYIVIKEY